MPKKLPYPVKALIVARGWTQKDVAEQVGVNQHTFGRIIGGSVEPWPALVQKLEELLGVPGDDLFRDTDGDPSSVVLEHVRRTTKASGVPVRLEDETTIANIAKLIGGAA